jgi:hypothetical protein
MMVIMVPEKRHVEIKWSHADAKRRGRRRGKNNAGECGNPQNSADLSHDQAPLEALQGWRLERQNNVQNAPCLPLVPNRIAEEIREARRSDRSAWRLTEWQIRLSRVAAPANA